MTDPVMDEQAFKEWLNDHRMYDVSYVFHEIVAKYRAALATHAEPKVDEISVERIVELIDASQFVYPESGREGFDQLGFARAVEKETKLTCSDDCSISGWQYVPVDLIDEMRAACKHLQYSDQIDEDWAAMLAKAPSPPKKEKQ